MSAKTLSIINQKGGVGKSTITFNLGSALAKRGFKILLLDLDSQSSITSLASIKNGVATINDVFLDEVNIKEAITKTATPNLSIIAGSIKLIQIDKVLDEVGKEQKLKTLFNESKIKNDYDYIILDTPPALGTLSVIALAASDYIVIPALPDNFSLQGIAHLSKNVEVIKKFYNPKLKILGIVLNLYTDTILSRDIAELTAQLAKNIKTSIFKVRLKNYTAYKEANAKKTNILDYDSHNKAAENFTDFVDELLKKIKGDSK